MAAVNKKSQKKKIDSEIGQALFTDTERFEMWFSAYWKPAAAVAVIAAVLAAGAFWAVSARNAAEKKAAFALADANTVEELTAAISENAGHAGVGIARYRLAKILIDSEKYQEALRQLDAVSQDASIDALLAAKARLSAGYVCELSGNRKEAITRFLAVESSAALPAAQRAEAGYCAGRLLVQAGDLDQAKAVLGRTALLGSGSAGTGYWTENAKQTLLAVESGEYAPGSAAKPVKAPAAMPAPAVKKPAKPVSAEKKPAAAAPAKKTGK